MRFALFALVGTAYAASAQFKRELGHEGGSTGEPTSSPFDPTFDYSACDDVCTATCEELVAFGLDGCAVCYRCGSDGRDGTRGVNKCHMGVCPSPSVEPRPSPSPDPDNGGGGLECDANDLVRHAAL